ncbi:hypothetical protein L1887_17059 [Cichorium endivia]|nr:hypothetical protein L1887_17059 [Cichorium endivia]
MSILECHHDPLSQHQSAPPTVIIATHAHPYPGVLHTPPLHAYTLTCHHQEQTYNGIQFVSGPPPSSHPHQKSEICERENTHTHLHHRLQRESESLQVLFLSSILFRTLHSFSVWKSFVLAGSINDYHF